MSSTPIFDSNMIPVPPRTESERDFKIIIQRIVGVVCFIVIFVAFLDIQLRGDRITMNEKKLFSTKDNYVNGSSDDNIFEINVLPTGAIKDLLKLRESVNSEVNNIWNYWQVDKYQKFLSTMHIPAISWQIQKMKFIKFIYDSLNVHSSEQKINFVIGFSGSSVTAGHDNRFNESYPFIFENSFGPILKLLNISLVVNKYYS